jgi:hypothetical protein
LQKVIVDHYCHVHLFSNAFLSLLERVRLSPLFSMPLPLMERYRVLS